MVSNMTDFGSAFDEWLEGLARLVRLYQTLRWRDVHPVARRPGSDSTLVGFAARHWLPTPSKSFIVTLSDMAERRGSSEFFHDAAAGVQRIAIADPTFRARYLELASQIEDLGRFEEGGSGIALQAHAELDKLLALDGASWSSLEEVLGEGHCLVTDLIILAWRRMVTQPEKWREILALIHRLRKIAGDTSSAPTYLTGRDMFFSYLELGLMNYWFEVAGLSDDIGGE